MTELRIHSFVPTTEVEGPGRRACVWVQGCSIRCPGCFNTHMWARDTGFTVTVDELASRIVETTGIEGVTFLGGEPFEQAEALADLAGRVRAAGLSVLTFSGYEYETLINSSRDGWGQLLAATDLLIDGPYDRTQPDHERPWVGSRNQEFRYLSPRYAYLASQLGSIPDGIEVRITSDGQVFLNGMCSADFLNVMRREVGRRPSADASRRPDPFGLSRSTP